MNELSKAQRAKLLELTDNFYNLTVQEVLEHGLMNPDLLEGYRRKFPLFLELQISKLLEIAQPAFFDSQTELLNRKISLDSRNAHILTHELLFIYNKYVLKNNSDLDIKSIVEGGTLSDQILATIIFDENNSE